MNRWGEMLKDNHNTARVRSTLAGRRAVENFLKLIKHNVIYTILAMS